MPKFLGYKCYCGHWLQVDTSIEVCQIFGSRFFHGRIITLSSGTKATIIGVAEKCPECISEETTEKVLY